VQNVRRASTLFEEDKETDKEVNQAEKIYVKDLRRPPMNGAKIIEVSPIEARVFRVGRSFHQVVKLTTNTSFVEINLY